MTYHSQKILGVLYYDARGSQGYLVFYWLWYKEFHVDFSKFSNQESNNGFGICEFISWFNFIYRHIFKKNLAMFSQCINNKNTITKNKVQIFIFSNAFRRKSFFQKVNKHVILINYVFREKMNYVLLVFQEGFHLAINRFYLNSLNYFLWIHSVTWLKKNI